MYDVTFSAKDSKKWDDDELAANLQFLDDRGLTAMIDEIAKEVGADKVEAARNENLRRVRAQVGGPPPPMPAGPPSDEFIPGGGKAKGEAEGGVTEMTVSQVEAAAADADAETVETWLDEERAGKNRQGALDALGSRLDELTDEEE